MLLTYLPMSSENNRRRGFAAKRATLQNKQEVARCRLLLTKSLGAEAAQIGVVRRPAQVPSPVSTWSSWSRGGPSSTSPHDYEISTWAPVDGDQETSSCLVENETTCEGHSSSPRADDLASALHSCALCYSHVLMLSCTLINTTSPVSPTI